MEKPYVISEELDLLNSDCIQKDKLDAFRESLDENPRALGKNTLWVASNDIQQGIKKYTKQTSLPIVSLDDRYVTSADGWLGISRGVDENLDDVGYAPRVGYSALDEQLNMVAKVGNEVTLVDDVVFSGDMITWLAEELRKRSIKIGSMICGIVIGDGLKRLNELGIDIEAVRAFDRIDDELCERDLVVAPGSGRRIESLNANALYFCDEYGRPAQWAAIPEESVAEFAARSYRRSAELLDPATSINDIGQFYGIEPNINAYDALLQKASQAEKRI